MHPRADQSLQPISLTTKKRGAQGMMPPEQEFKSRFWARVGEGALAPSCRAPQGHDQTLGKFPFFLIFSTCGRRKSQKCRLATATSQKNHSGSKWKTNFPQLCRDHVARGSSGLQPHRRQALGKVPSHLGVLQAVLVKIVTEILFGNAPLANLETSVLAADHTPAH